MSQSAVIETENGIAQFLVKVLEFYQFSEKTTVHSNGGLRSLLHCFVSLEKTGFFRAPRDVEKSSEKLITSVVDTMNPSL
jgi:hypothetical protein